VVAQVNEDLAPFRLLTGIEVDILLDGSLDQYAHIPRRASDFAPLAGAH